MPQIDELERLAALKEKGVLSEQEFAEQKAKILSRNERKQRQDSQKDGQKTGDSKGMPVVAKVFVTAIGFVVAFFVIGFFLSQKYKSKARERGHAVTEYQAFSRCEEMIKRMSRNPSSAKISRVPGTLVGDTYYFRWSPAEMQLQNGFGAMIGSSGSCQVDAKTGRAHDILLN